MTALRAGMKVVCVSTGIGDEPGATPNKYPAIGQVYTVRSVRTFVEGVGVHLEEFVNPPMLTKYGFIEGYWRAGWFRPAVERKTSIEVFQKMLVPTKQKEPV